MIDEYGADAIRLYLLNSPAVEAEDLAFQKGEWSGDAAGPHPALECLRLLVHLCEYLRLEALASIKSSTLPTSIAGSSRCVKS